ncbi:MAG TPA: hypothetical protein IGS52_12190 [Oscillatoriaceae cyanobacterium M33_DOE_052]|nr:hypothetical protein [Oscillatoriaceae cyanobacterium M33_DOE_052]
MLQLNAQPKSFVPVVGFANRRWAKPSQEQSQRQAPGREKQYEPLQHNGEQLFQCEAENINSLEKPVTARLFPCALWDSTHQQRDNIGRI